MAEVGGARIGRGVGRGKAAAPGPDRGVKRALVLRPLARMAILVLAILHTVAIFAPCIANDRPWVLRAVDRGGYEEALRTLAPIAASAGRILAAGGTASTRENALELERKAALERIEKLERALAASDRAPLERWRDSFEEMIDAEARGEHARALGLAGEVETRARELREELASGDARQPESGGKILIARQSYPLLESLSGFEVFTMLAWIGLLCGPLGGLLVRFPARRPRARTVAGVICVAALLAFAWERTRPAAPAPFETAPYKEALDAGDLVPEKSTIFAPLPYGYAETHALEIFAPPSWTSAARARSEAPASEGPRARAGEPGLDSPWRFLAGTDELGRDLLTRMIWGARESLAVGLLSALLLTFLGVVFGALAGHFGGWIDVIILRAMEILQSIPALVLVLFAMAFTDPRIVPPAVAIVLLIALVRWTGAARLVRGEFLRLREREYVLAARALGYSPARTILLHILPNAAGPILVHAAFAVSAGILTESAISFLGLGVEYPAASWGALVGQAKNPAQWWVQLFPGLLIFATVTCYNLVGDAVREALDPRAQP